MKFEKSQHRVLPQPKFGTNCWQRKFD